MPFPRVKLSRLFAFALLGAALLASAVTLQPAEEDAASPPPAAEARAQALSRCSALGPRDAGDPACTALWKAERERFLGIR